MTSSDLHIPSVDDFVEIASTKTPGMLLSAARNARGLSKEQVAKNLYLTTTVIEQLEADIYNTKVGLIFERGYLRAYSRLLGIDEREISAAFQNLNIEDPKPNELPKGMYVRPITANRSSRLSVMSIGVAILASVAFAVYLLIPHQLRLPTNPFIKNISGNSLPTTQSNQASTSPMQHDLMIPKKNPDNEAPSPQT